MTELCEGVALGLVDDKDTTCPFCEGKGSIALRNLTTKHGAQKDEDRLRENMESSADTRSENGVSVHPTPGGGDPHAGWIVAAGILNELPVSFNSTPHHLIPGDDVMAGTKIETWTRDAAKKTKQDIGYNIDCAQNGIFLPHLPTVNFTKTFEYVDEKGKTWTEGVDGKRMPKKDPKDKADKTKRKRFADIFGSWGELPDDRQRVVGYLVMGDTWLQMHYTSHGAGYKHIDATTNYNKEVLQQLDLLSDALTAYAAPRCPHAKDPDDDKYFPPYGLNGRLNAVSARFRVRITGKPSVWRSFVSPLAQDYGNATTTGEVRIVQTFNVRRK